MRVWGSLRFRLMAAAAVWIVVALTAGYLAFSSIFRSQVNSEFDDELHIHVQEVERITRFNRQGAAVQRLPFSDPRYEDPGSGFYWEVSDGDRVLFASGSLQGKPIGRLPQDEGELLAWALDLPLDKVSPDSRFAEDLEVDSLDFLQLVMAVEEATGLRLDDKAAAAARSVGELLALVRQARQDAG